MRVGVRLGIDVGSVRVGVAVSDRDGLLATPLETVAPHDIGRIADIADERQALELVVGLPRSLSGGEGPAAAAARDYARALAVRVAPRPVRLVDERLSTVAAGRGLRSAGLDSRRARAVIDQVAASEILQAALDAERTGGTAPGELVVP